ncbi:MAG: CRISPR-associated endonuclease Cas2 [Candidatus Heimdallarchaeum endolithica]|uniref:CRISPR-associated endoribonuclease Cas2 n=1 Tax=Candidatus Heimdallarchaeum endolithica TaxID=2876572 RepID=A0A9Y1BR77_9ARCH|nr:MAG: CRISPR-associated endonuclease Cas2 [Candidatus Heimdallarchaeum endolithica]
MYVIIVYDIKVERIDKVRKFLKTYLEWIQNSVFEGEITKAEMRSIIKNLEKMIKKTEDSVLVYTLRDEKYLERKEIGIQKGNKSNIL